VIALAGSLAPGTVADASTSDAVTVFRAFTATGKPILPTKSVSGYCWTGSLAAPRNDAWRCFVGNGIYDPCFSSTAAPGVVLCPNYELTSDIQIRLTRPLPLKQADHGTASVHGHPWLIELETFTVPNGGSPRCEISTGATNVIDGTRLNYFCTGGGAFATMGLWGFPKRQQGTWVIVMAPFEAKTIKGARLVAVRHMWT